MADVVYGHCGMNMMKWEKEGIFDGSRVVILCDIRMIRLKLGNRHERCKWYRRNRSYC